MLASVLGFGTAVAVSAGVMHFGCGGGDDPPGKSIEEPPPRVSTVQAPPPSHPSAPVPSASAKVAELPDAGAPRAADGKEVPWDGPLIGAVSLQTPVYPAPDFGKDRIGYIRAGGKAPVDPTPIKNGYCPKGWYRLIDGGYVCAKHASLDVNGAQVRNGITAAKIEEVLPYLYAYNTAHGTPLYRSVPSREEMLKYEPYLEKKNKKKDGEESGEHPVEPPVSADLDAGVLDDAAAPAPPAVDPAALALLDAGAADPPPDDRPWWQRDSEDKGKLDVKLADLEADADGTVAKRMVKGFFVAVDKTFGYSGRLWYKTTSGLVAPTDRMIIPKAPSSKGIEFPSAAKAVGFVTASKATKYQLEEGGKKVKPGSSLPRFSAFGLTGETLKSGSQLYRETTDGFWMRASDGTSTEPGPRPGSIGVDEKWIDVNLSRKTLVAFEGDRMVYAALVSPGKKSKNKDKDHATPTGTFRIREKHLAVTMDGDGTVAGDMPYSIEDVPYVAYYDRSYALHAAFWHSAFGHEMSHGCVNLSPLDAKYVFFWSGPRLPRGWHGVWATEQNRGTTVVVHE